MQIARSVRDFVAPLEPSGSLDATSTALLEEDAAQAGTRLHIKLQKRLSREFPGVRCEQTLLTTLQEGDFSVLVRGRLDVLVPGEPLLVEEIKTTVQPQVLLRALADDGAHLFAQQVRMYAWMLMQDGAPAPRCRLRVVSLLDEHETLVEIPFDPTAFTAWVNAQVAALHEAHLHALARAEARRVLGDCLRFPFETLRPGQDHLMASVASALVQGDRLMLQAPTGLGKTAAVLFPALQQALAEDLRVFYITPRNSQHAVAEAFVRHLPGVRSVTVRAKERVCPQDEVHCHPDACPRALGYYDRLKASGVLDDMEAAGCADGAVIEAAADHHMLCPFELSLDAARRADIVIGDYNYALSPNATLARFFGTPEQARRHVVLVDEAHNLPSRACDWFSPSLDQNDLDGLKHGWPGRKQGALRGAFLRQLKRCVHLVGAHEGPSRKLDVDCGLFNAEEQRIRRLVAKATGAGTALVPSHPLIQLQRRWAEFCGVAREMGEATVCTWIPPGRLQITCLDASDHLAARFKALAGAVLFSATLKPFPYYARLTGLADGALRQEEVPSPFPGAHRRVLIVPQVSTLLRRRDGEAPRIGQFLSRVLPLRHGNYVVFFPSFAFLEMTLPHVQLPGFDVIPQPRQARPEALKAILQALMERQGIVVLAVMGGSLSEGVDLPGEALIGCVVAGPPLPPFDLEHRLAKAYFDAKGWDGEAFTYIYPAMAKAIQAAGRVIRGPEERGLLVFLDSRFLDTSYAECFPTDWFRKRPAEAVSDAILADVARFWSQGG